MTESELIAALRSAWDDHRSALDDSGALTAREIVELVGWSRQRVEVTVRALVQSGAWECVRVPRQMIHGAIRKEPAYRPVRIP